MATVKLSESARRHQQYSAQKYAFKTKLRRFLCFLPTRKGVVIFQSSDDFSDSSRALYEYLNSHQNHVHKIYWAVDDLARAKQTHPEIHSFAVCARKGQYLSFLRGFFIQTIAEYCFYTHTYIGNEFKRHQHRVFITHAAPPVKNSTGFFWPAEQNTDIITTSDFAAKYRAMTLGGGKGLYRNLGLPRNDALFTGKKSTVKKTLGITSAKIIIWMPTFKHHKDKKRVDFADSRQNDISLLTPENLTELQNTLAKNHITLIIKPHPAQDMDSLHVTESANIKILTNAQLEAHGLQTHQLLGVCDALITDFSSAYFDFLLVNKPIAFELTDAAAYSKNVGYIFENPSDYMPGFKIRNLKDFETFIRDIANDKDSYSAERQKLCALDHEHPDGQSTSRVLKYFKLID